MRLLFLTMCGIYLNSEIVFAHQPFFFHSFFGGPHPKKRPANAKMDLDAPQKFIPRSKLSRTLTSWMIRHGSMRRQRRVRMASSSSSSPSSSSRTSRKPQGSMVTWRKPTLEHIAQWFASASSSYASSWQQSSSQQLVMGILQSPFNHPYAGMTNPSLHVHETTTTSWDVTHQSSRQTTSVNQINDHHHDNDNDYYYNHHDHPTNDHQAWWPSILVPTTTNNNNNNNNNNNKYPWRIIRHCRRVGTGWDCYQQVRDAVLDWNFQDSKQTMGMIPIPETKSTTQQQGQQSSTNISRGRFLSIPLPVKTQQQQAKSLPTSSSSSSSSTMSHSPLHQQLWSGPGGKRFVTYTDALAKFRRRIPIPFHIYSINPVMVVYDLVDQRYVNNVTSCRYHHQHHQDMRMDPTIITWHHVTCMSHTKKLTHSFVLPIL